MGDRLGQPDAQFLYGRGRQGAAPQRTAGTGCSLGGEPVELRRLELDPIGRRPGLQRGPQACGHVGAPGLRDALRGRLALIAAHSAVSRAAMAARKPAACAPNRIR